MLAGVLGIAAIVLVVIYVAIGVLTIVACVKIISKAGYSGWWVLLGLVPIVNMVMFFVFAFSDWPSLRGRRTERSDPAWPNLEG